MSKHIYIDSNGNEVLVSGTITNAGNLPLGSDFSDPNSTAYAVKDLQDGKQSKVMYHQETTTPDSGGVFNIGVSTTYIPISCTTTNGYIQGFVHSGGYWYGRIVSYAGAPVTSSITVTTFYIETPT